MTIVLKPETEKLIRDLMKRGRFTSESDVIEAAVTSYAADESQYDWAYIRKAVQEGLEDLEAGRFVELSEDEIEPFFDDIKRRGRERLKKPSKQTG